MESFKKLISFWLIYKLFEGFETILWVCFSLTIIFEETSSNFKIRWEWEFWKIHQTLALKTKLGSLLHLLNSSICFSHVFGFKYSWGCREFWFDSSFDDPFMWKIYIFPSDGSWNNGFGSWEISLKQEGFSFLVESFTFKENTLTISL